MGGGDHAKHGGGACGAGCPLRLAALATSPACGGGANAALNVRRTYGVASIGGSATSAVRTVSKPLNPVRRQAP